MARGDRIALVRRIGWFVGIWAASVCVLAVVSGLLRLVIVR